MLTSFFRFCVSLKRGELWKKCTITSSSLNEKLNIEFLSEQVKCKEDLNTIIFLEELEFFLSLLS